eukprot:TRINITY_DN20140_c0_g1_i1.p1 TRINITY_DN20140_c0_g1~~TRINITY_DN20140_c0_g1_i1.p1  ORF type:complete len:317 (-),score=77.62 TRINITY_DN20140_c0_g1_i1:67-1017(-)
MTSIQTANDIILWRQRVEKENRVNCEPTSGGFSVRSAVATMQVPIRFKPGHVDPAKERDLGGFNPEAVGWDPEGAQSKAFRRAMLETRANPCERFLFPQTSYQEHGWLLNQPGELNERFRGPPRDKIGIGWRSKTRRGEESSVAPSAPPVPADTSTLNAAAALQEALPPMTDAPGSCVSATAPAFSTLSASAPAVGSRVSASQPVNRSASQLSMAAPLSQLSAAGASSILSRASSLPALPPKEHKERLAWVRRREEKVMKAFAESSRYLNKGARGAKWDRPLGITDATSFQNAFCKATGGVPLHLYGKNSPDPKKE